MMKKIGASVVLKNKPFRLFLLSQGVSSFGDTFQLIAVTALIFKLTGSGLYAGFGLLSMPICSLLFSIFAGSLADSIYEKYILIINDLLRGIIVILFAFSGSIVSIYSLLFILAILNIFYIPPSRKFIMKLLRPEELLIGNSILIGISGAAYLFGPILAGVIVGIWGVDIAFWVNGLSFFYSGFQIIFIKTSKYKIRQKLRVKMNLLKQLSEEIRIGLECFFKFSDIKELVMISTMFGLGNAAVNFGFFTFAFQVLKVTNLGWGFMISVLYGSNLIALFISMFLEKRSIKNINLFIYLQFLSVSIIWLCYGFTESFSLVILLQIIEGIASALFWMFLITRLQLVTPTICMGRIIAVNEILGNVGKIVGICMSYFIIDFYSSQKVFIVSSLFCIFYLFYRLMRAFKSGIIEHKNV